MKFLITITIAFGVIQFFGAKAELSIVTFDAECTIVDPEYFKDVEVYIEDEGRDNEFFVNFTLIKMLPKSATNRLRMIGASMGEYKVPTGIDFEIPLCEAISEPIFGRRIYKALGLDENVCPAMPGVYGGSHINLVDQDTLPETFPPNNYLLLIEAPYESKLLYQLKVYFRIQ